MGLIYIWKDYLSGSAKESLSTVLEREKLELALPITGMAGDILPLQKSLHSSLQIKRITDQAGLLDYADVNCEAYGFPLEWGRSGLSGSTLWTEKAYSFLGYENDRAVSAASAIVNDGCLYLALVHRVRGSLSDWFNAIISILNSPAEGCGGFVVIFVLKGELSGLGGVGSEDFPRDDSAVNFVKTDMHVY